MLRWLYAVGTVLALAAPARAANVTVRTVDEFRRAVQSARAGAHIRLAAGDYAGGSFFQNVRGEQGRPIVIEAADAQHPPRFVGGAEALHFSDAAYLELRDLVLTGGAGNGLNVDDAGTFDTPAHDIVLRNLRVTDVGPKGNRDGMKLSGLDGFLIDGCTVERWGDGGSAIDMVGCHRGIIERCTFRTGVDTGVQTKGGSSDIRVRNCLFENAGSRAVNIGGSTGLPYFRPQGARYEAKDIRVEGCTFIGGDAPVAFVGTDGAVVRFNTIYHPRKWALRILEETREPGFVPSRNGRFEDNIVVFQSQSWAEAGVNVGTGTAPQTFAFARNVWYCEDRPDRSRPILPTAETGAIIGKDPLFRDPARGEFGLKQGSPASGRGAGAYPAAH